MDKNEDINLNQELNKKSEDFINKMNSEMHYKSDLESKEMTFDWVNEIELACPYIDNIARNPKVALIREEDVVKIEKAKKTTVASVKDLSRHTHFIDKIDEKTGDVTPSKLLIERNEETFNTYENRFIYTLIDTMSRFIMKKEALLDDLKIKDDKVLEYAATTVANKERVRVELKISSNDLAKNSDNLEKEIEEIRKKIERMKMFIASWRKTEFFTSLDKAHVPFVIPPIKKTNLILKNPNFQVATKLWDYLQRYDEDETESKDNIDTTGDNLLKGIMDDAFLMNYYVLDAISLSKREQKKKLADYAVVMIYQQIRRVISMLLNSGINISDQQILDILTNELKKERNKGIIDSTDVKNKFKNELEEYLEKTKNYL